MRNVVWPEILYSTTALALPGDHPVEFLLGAGYSTAVSTIALELDNALAALGDENARALESAVRQQISRITREEAEWKCVMALMQKNHPHAAECVGIAADTNLERPSQGDVPDAKVW